MPTYFKLVERFITREPPKAVEDSNRTILAMKSLSMQMKAQWQIKHQKTRSPSRICSLPRPCLEEALQFCEASIGSQGIGPSEGNSGDEKGKKIPLLC